MAHSVDSDAHTTSDSLPKQPSRWRRVWRWLQQRTRFLHPPVLLAITLSPSECYQQLEKIARPSVQRLHLSDLFARGRRYHLEPGTDQGFRMTTTNKVSWHPRRRTSASAVLRASFQSSEESDITYLRIQGQIRVVYLLQSLFWPLFITSMVVYMPWHPLLKVLPVICLSLAAWLGYRYNAKLEAHDMLFFIEKALEDYIPDSPALPAQSADIIYGAQQDFVTAWERFYDEQQQPATSSDDRPPPADTDSST